MQSITLKQPDDWHIHLRDHQYLKTTVSHAARLFRRAIIMPNLNPPIRTPKEALSYRERIMKHVPKDCTFNPLMTVYLTDQTTQQTIQKAKTAGIIAAKLYPANVTTHSKAGVTDIKKLYPVFEAMQQAGLLLLLHGEVSDPKADIFDRERLFLTTVLKPLLYHFPSLKIVLEHITTKEAVDFVKAGPKTLAATITAHHLWITRNDLLKGGIHPHYYCLPVAQRTEDKQALIQAATSGNEKFFIGTDSAPHPENQKICPQGCAGIYTAHAAIELYTEIFERANALERLESFLSLHGPKFYRITPNSSTIKLIKQSWTVPNSFALSNQEKLIPFQAGQSLNWQIESC